MKTLKIPASVAAARTLIKRWCRIHRVKQLVLLFRPQITIVIATLLMAIVAPDETGLSAAVQTAQAVTWWFGILIVVAYCISSVRKEHVDHPHSKALLIPVCTAVERSAWIYVAARSICALHAPVDDVISWVISNPSLSIAAAFGGGIALFTLALWRVVNQKYVNGNYSPYAQLIPPEPIDPVLKRRTAVHEAGHALFYSAVSPLPAGLTACVAQRLGADDKMGGYVDSGNTRPKNFTMQYLEWRMLIALAGCEAEYVVYGERGQGGEADYENWLEDATTWLSSGCGEHYYHNAKSQAEAASNRDVLTRLKFSHIAIVRAFLRQHDGLLKELALEFSKHECLDVPRLKPFLDKVDLTGHDGIPRLTINQSKD